MYEIAPFQTKFCSTILKFVLFFLFGFFLVEGYLLEAKLLEDTFGTYVWKRIQKHIQNPVKHPRWKFLHK